MYTTPCVIFAGGKSSRMGEDKALLPFADSKTLVQFQYNRLSKLFQNVYISCKSQEKFDFEGNFIEDLNQELFAPTTAFISIFNSLQCDRFFAMSVDTPFIDQEIIDTLFSNDLDDIDATIAMLNEKIQPLCGIYHRSLLHAFETMEKDDNHKLGFLLKKSNVNVAEFIDQEKFLNLNNKEEYNKALEILNASLI